MRLAAVFRDAPPIQQGALPMKRLIPFALMLLSPTASFAGAEDRELWISLGADAMEPVAEAFAKEGWKMPPPSLTKKEVSVIQVRESQLERIAHVMHEKFNRCAGFVTFETRDEAEKSLVPAPLAPTQELVTYTIDNAAAVNCMIGRLTESGVRSTINTMAAYTTRYYTHTTGVNAANGLRTLWANIAASRSDITATTFTHAAWAQPSVILTIPGSTLASEVVVVGGHLDSISSGATAPGADDNASGIASFTEVIRAAVSCNYRPLRTVKFIGYAAEEVGLRGSKEIAAWHKNNGVNVVGVLQLDMTNYKRAGNTHDVGVVTDYTNSAQNTFLRNIITTYGGGIVQRDTTCGYACSDHASWTAQGYAASIPHESTVNTGNPYIHTVNDTIAQSGSNANHALKFSKIAAGFVGELAKGVTN
ncbi:M20/M25/M40 family metallo-hydrolase [Myxococcus sp. K38C18041901]|uniref:M20/M25/M40 family metallo-hydrolase n=1 Tax=Myxococcus guangdongensis TaxID=2906760 RepID=UPI0020A827E5|nr:M20/M25/M40 family metallo-hydrolase [Myxococcus guangdongensis]MCP3062295.1 M20/M25/M40 family metallo-hydrolase [Myxococcus guangdongensis]